ncbi:MAG: hypothetical protein O3B41_07105 [Bacteroidetes bacterium]|nr:hypothetical protein [Bacteroidota bacterium]
MNLSFGHSPWLFFLLLFLAIGASWWTYRTTVPEIKPLFKLLLGALRSVSLGLILLLLFEPILQKISNQEIEPVVAVVIDASESMSLADSLLGDDGASLASKTASIKRSLEGLDVRFYTFGGDIEELDSLQTLSAVESRTDIATALIRVNEDLSDVPLRSVILVSDGLYNSGRNPIRVAESYQVPIFTIAHGDSTLKRDVRIVQVISNELTFAGSTVPVLVRVRNDGYTSGQLTVRLQDEGKLVDQVVIPVPATGTESEVELSYLAAEAGRTNLSIGINRFEGEATYRNNSSTVSIVVLDQKKKVLVLAGAPSPDVSNLARIIALDQTTEIVTLIQAPDGTFYDGQIPGDFSDIDLIVSVGFPGKSTPPAVSAAVAEAVKGGSSLLFVLDKETNLTAIQRDFNALLPVTLRSIRSGFLEGSFVETTAAASHAIFDTGFRSDNSRWNRLPPVLINESRWEPAPSATVLATTQMRGIPIGDPVFVVGRTGSSKSAVLLAHGFWKWTNVPEDLEAESNSFKEILTNTVQWLYATDDNRLVRVTPSESEYGEGDSVILRGEVYDETLRPISDASLSVELTDPDGQKFPFEMTLVGNGRYTLDVGSLPAGFYTYAATARRNDGEIGTDDGQFSIGRRTLEFRNTRADFALMSQIALRSGGAAITSSEIDGIPSLLQNLPDFRSVTYSSASQLRLWQKWPFLVLILLVLTVEWFFRKRFGMV